MKFFILRHAEDNPNIIGGCSDLSLTMKGKRQARELRDFVIAHKEKFNIKKIISSDLTRAVQTVTPLAKSLHLEIERATLFRALNWGDLNGLSVKKAKRLYPKMYLQSLALDEAFPGGGESPKRFYQRVVSSWKYIHKKFANGEDNVLICTHGQQFNIFLSLCNKSKWDYKTDYRVFLPCLILEFDTITKGVRPIMPLEEYQKNKTSLRQKTLIKLKKWFSLGA